MTDLRTGSYHIVRLTDDGPAHTAYQYDTDQPITLICSGHPAPDTVAEHVRVADFQVRRGLLEEARSRETTSTSEAITEEINLALLPQMTAHRTTIDQFAHTSNTCRVCVTAINRTAN